MSEGIKKRKLSDIWNFFNPIDLIKAECNLCKMKLSYKTSISNLKKHLQKKHPTVPLPLKLNLKPNDSNDNCSRNINVDLNIEHKSIIQPLIQTKRTLDTLKTKKFPAKSKNDVDRHLLEMFVKDLQPFSIVEDSGFKKFIHALNPNYQLPDRHSISRAFIPALYEETRNSTKQILQNAGTLCLTADCWTSVNSTSFMAVTVHFVDQNFKFNSLLLDCCEMNPCHTSQHLSHELRLIINDWDIDDKQILLAVTDNDENIKNAIEIELRLKRLDCVAHTLNLVVRESLELESISQIISKLKTIVEHFKTCSNSADVLSANQSNNGSNPLKLIQDIPTRWNSTLYMIERFCTLKEHIKNTMESIDADLPALTSIEWDILEEMVLILKPFEEATRTLSDDKYCSASLVIPIVNGLFNVMTKLQSKFFSENSTFLIIELKNNLSNRLSAIEKNHTLMICTFLDPRFKTLAFSNQNSIDFAKENIINLLVSVNNKNEQLSSSSTSFDDFNDDDLSIWDSFHKNISKSGIFETATSHALTEVQRYLEDAIISQKENPLTWWKTNKIVYPNLATLASQYLCLLASCVPCERIFSKAGQLFGERRSRLSRKHLKMVLFLNQNFND